MHDANSTKKALVAPTHISTFLMTVYLQARLVICTWVMKIASIMMFSPRVRLPSHYTKAILNERSILCNACTSTVEVLGC